MNRRLQKVSVLRLSISVLVPNAVQSRITYNLPPEFPLTSKAKIQLISYLCGSAISSSLILTFHTYQETYSNHPALLSFCTSYYLLRYILAFLYFNTRRLIWNPLVFNNKSPRGVSLYNRTVMAAIIYAAK